MGAPQIPGDTLTKVRDDRMPVFLEPMFTADNMVLA